ncbi:hypothetical protein ABZ319_19835 [Nocardia sp. NPDC005978]|uniref:hypothetical protein n=1 Tax=Nocardia sp. NPDC005978 TaxID=3156725 RepID=UPI0033A0CA13
MREDIAELVSSGTRRSRSVRVRSTLNPQVAVVAEIGSRPVQDYGTFDGPEPVHMVSVLVAVDQHAACPGTATPAVTYLEAVAWLTVLLPDVDAFYLTEDPAACPGTDSPRWFFNCFIDRNGHALGAPDDFDWVSFRIRHRGMRVSRIDRDGCRIETTYENPCFADFYQPRSESRGRYWPMALTPPPPDAEISRCFTALAVAIARRTAIAAHVEPLSLTWTRDNTTALVIRDIGGQRCYRVDVHLPTDDDLTSGTYPSTGALGDISTMVTSPEQYAAGQVARLRSIGIDGIRRQGFEIACPATL